MNKLILGATTAALAFLPAALQAQAIPAAVVAVVDTDRIAGSCTVCTAANTQLQGQATQLQQRAEQLGAPLRTEEQALQQAVSAIPQGQQPNAQLTARIQTFQTNQQNAAREIEGRQQQIQRNIAFVRQQIAQRLQPAIQQVAQQRGATIVVDRGATLFSQPTVDLTSAVLAVVNQNTTPLNVNAPPPQQPAQQQQQQQQQRPQGR